MKGHAKKVDDETKFPFADTVHYILITLSLSHYVTAILPMQRA